MSNEQPPLPASQAAPVTRQETSSKALPTAWIERIFTVMAGYYGKHFADLWAGQPIDTVKAVWAEALGPYSGAEITRGMQACKSLKFPPTLPEFLQMCRPPMDFEVAFHEAVRQMEIRRNPERGEGGELVSRDRWSHPAIYWAAVKIGADLWSHPYASIKGRWKSAIEAAMLEGCPEVPPFREALPAPGKTRTTAQEAARRLAEIRQELARREAQKAEQTKTPQPEELPAEEVSQS